VAFALSVTKWSEYGYGVQPITLTTTSFVTPRSEVLLAHGYWDRTPRWLLDVDAELRPSGFDVCWARSGTETIQRVEAGGLTAAVLVADRVRLDGLSLLRIIRSITAELPCWLVTLAPTRATLQAALELRVASVIEPPLDPVVFTLAMKKLITN